MEIVLKKKKHEKGFAYHLTEEQINNLLLKEKEKINVDDIILEENLLFYSSTDGFCIVREKLDKRVFGEEYWYVEGLLESDNKSIQRAITRESFKKLISINAKLISPSGEFKGYIKSHCKAILQ